MSFILDAILIVMCIVCVAVGTKRGFVKTVMSLLSSVISAIAAYTFTPYFANFIKGKIPYGVCVRRNSRYDTFTCAGI